MANRMEIIKRDDSDFQLTFKDIDGNAIDLTNGVVFFTVKKVKIDTDVNAIIKKEITTFDDASSGIALLSLTAEETDISAGDYWFDIQLKDSNGKITSSSAGRFLVMQDITIRTDLS